MNLLEQYKFHNCEKERFRRFHLNKKIYRKWLLKYNIKSTSATWNLFKKSDRYLKTLTLEEFTNKISSSLSNTQL